MTTAQIVHSDASTERKNIVAWFLAIVLAIVFIPSGILMETEHPKMVALFQSFGYPSWFMHVIGLLEIWGGSLVLLPRLSLYGISVITCVMIGAIASHLSHGQGAKIGGALVMLAIAFSVGTLRAEEKPSTPKASAQTRMSRLSPWFSRLVLALGVIVLAAVGARFLIDPMVAAAASRIAAVQAVGWTNLRVGFGAFPLAFALALMTSFGTQPRRIAGLSLLALVAGTAFAVRLAGAFADQTIGESVHLLRPEGILLVASSAAIVLELLIRRQGDRNN